MGFVNRLFLIVFFLLIAPLAIFAQDQDIALIKKYAENAFRDKDYEFALENYLELYKNNKSDIDLNYRIGICYTETNIDKEKAIPFLEFVLSHNNYQIRTFYFLGKAYMYNYRFTEAVEAFYEYKMVGINEEELAETDRMIDMCYYALELINYPKNVTFTRLDTTINSKFDEYNPYISSDKSSLYFTSNRTYIKEYENYISSGFYSDSKKGMWYSSTRIPVSSFDNEEVVGISPTGDKILIYANGDYATHDIKMDYRKGSKFSKALPSDLPSDMNTEGIEMGACLSPDGNTIYYASNKRGGRGGLDLYFSKKGADGKWGASENIGSLINTEYDENYPSLSADGKILYFASKGHDGIGGYDIFQSFYSDDTKTWTTPRNMGFPISTPLDNTTISFAPDGKTAYMAAKRKEGVGNLDIYQLTFGDEAQQTINYIGTVMVGDQNNSVPYTEDFLKAYATFYDMYNNIIAQWEVVAESGGMFFASLYPGEYQLEVKFEGQASGYKERVVISPADQATGILKTIYLKPIK
jgi:hypothetical protein